jgi:hypothetical protein
VRRSADVLIAVLTQQKYNDAAVREFFSAAAASGKTVIVIFNMVVWPAQRERLAGWLKTFSTATGIAPAAVYAAPHDPVAADAGQITFHAIPELTADGRDLPPAERLATADFDALKRRAMQGALAVVLDAKRGLGPWLDAFGARSAAWQDSLALLEREGRVRMELPPAPRDLVWREIWAWLEPRRSKLDLVVSRGYGAIGGGLAWGSVVLRW